VQSAVGALDDDDMESYFHFTPHEGGPRSSWVAGESLAEQIRSFRGKAALRKVRFQPLFTTSPGLPQACTSSTADPLFKFRNSDFIGMN
jgi:hypothetical protein